MALIESINTRDMPGFFHNFRADADAVYAAVGVPNLMMQMDCDHMQIMEDDLSACAAIPRAAGWRSVTSQAIFELLDGQRGWIGYGYRPAGKTRDGLGWVRPWL